MNIATRKPSFRLAAAAFIAKEKKPLIDGKRVSGQSRRTFPVEDAATEAGVAYIPAGDQPNVDLGVAAARGAFCINNHNYGDPAWPFGGYRHSGWDPRWARKVMEHCTETKAIGSERKALNP